MTGRRRVVGTLLASRVWEQAILGGASLLLAARLSLRGFAPVSAVFIVNSLAVTISDLGLGYDILRQPPGDTVARRSLTQMRLCNLLLAAVSVAVGLALSGDARTVVVASGVIWFTSAEAFVRKSGALRLDAAREAAKAEIVSSSVFAILVVAGAWGAQALVVTAAAFCVKHLVEVAIVRTWRATLSADGRPTPFRDLGGTQLLSFVISNVDYVVVAQLLGAAAFAAYSLAYRLASVVPAQVANVTTRVSIVDFGHTGDTAARQSIYTRYVTRLFVAGVAGAVATAAVVPLLPVVLGERWQPVVGLTIVFVAVAPWRLILGLAGSLAISVGRTRSLLGWETARLVATTAVMVAGAAVSIRGAALADDLTIIAAVLVLHALACRASGIRMVRGSILAAVATVLAVAPLLLLVTAPK